MRRVERWCGVERVAALSSYRRRSAPTPAPKTTSLPTITARRPRFHPRRPFSHLLTYTIHITTGFCHLHLPNLTISHKIRQPLR
ncbi:unnamed protein product [Leptosia nina]|uniref:Uncharacterized protein n=1 Tax=Leptosia nina TaxID=320188 RepID=A0AAV1JQB6_9NEOP